MINAKDANEKTFQQVQARQRIHGAEAAIRYGVVTLIEAAVDRGAYSVSFSVMKEDAHSLCRYIQSFGYRVEYKGDRSSSHDTMTVEWTNSVVDDR